MFKFTEETANEIVTGINGEATQMETDASSWDAQATENDKKAEECLSGANAADAKANIEEASCPHYTTETYTDTDEEGNSVEKERSVPDTEADSKALANAASLRAEAARLRAEAPRLRAAASALRALAAALRMTVGMLRSRQQKINQAIVATQTAVSFTVNLLVEGTNMAKQAVEAFNVPEKKFTKEWASSVGTNLLKVVGVDLSDGLNDELYVAIGVATQLGTVAGTIAVRYTVSLINSKIGNGIIGSVTKYGVKTASDIMIETYLGKTGAKVAQNAIASALTLHGINALPTDRTKLASNQTKIETEVKNNTKLNESKKAESKTEAKVENATNVTLKNNAESNTKGSSSNATAKLEKTASTSSKTTSTSKENKTTTVSNVGKKLGEKSNDVNFEEEMSKRDTYNANNGKTTNNVTLKKAQEDYANVHSEINHKKDQISNYNKKIELTKNKIDNMIDNLYKDGTSPDEQRKISSEIERLNNSVISMEQSNKKTQQEINEFNKKESDILKTINQIKK